MAIAFQTIDAAEMPRPANYNGTNKALQAEYDEFVSSLKPGQAGVISATDGGSARSIRMYLRYSVNRLGLKIDSAVSKDDGVYFTVSKA
jgi:hypothetical protein